MSYRPNLIPSSGEVDGSLAPLFDDLIERLQAGEDVDFQAVIHDHPEHADSIRRMLPALKALVEFGESTCSGPNRREGPAVVAETTARSLGDFRILKEIGRGGMGVVYEAEQRSLSRRVALKVLPMAAALDARQFQRFQLEAQAAACLHHHNIVPVFAVGVEGGVPFYAMQFIEGRSLADVIVELRRLERGGADAPPRGQMESRPLDVSSTVPARDLTPVGGGPAGPLPRSLTEAAPPVAPDSAPTPSPLGASTRTRSYVQAVAGLALQCAEALDHAHARGVLHRDIKPANLLLDAESRLWVTDFGLAQIQGSHGLTLTGDVMGTLRYMSPEQALARRVVIDGRTDVYSLGVTLYELLTLRPAFDGKDRAEILRRIAEEEPKPIRRLNPVVPVDLETVVQKAMAKDPSGRYATAREFADDLRRFLETKPIAAVRPGPLVRARKWALRHREATAAIVLIVITATALAAGWAWTRSVSRARLAQGIDRAVIAARASLQANDPAAALRHLAEARGQLSQAEYGDSLPTAELENLTAEASSRVAAEERYQRFEALRRRLYSVMDYGGKLSWDDRLRIGLEALDLYQVLATNPWSPPQAFHDLPAPRQVVAREHILELLYMTARIETYGGRSAEETAQRRRSAIDKFERMEAIDGVGPGTARWKAYFWKELADKERVTEETRRAEAQAARNPLDECMIGDLLLLFEDRIEEGLACYYRALRDQPHHFLSINSASIALFNLKRYEAAEAMLTGLLAMDRENLDGYRMRGDCRVKLNKLDAALEDYRALATLDPSDTAAYQKQALVLEQQGDRNRVSEVLALARARGADSSFTHSVVAETYMEIRRYDEADAEWAAAIDLIQRDGGNTPDNVRLSELWLNRGLTAARAGRRDNALKYMGEAIRVQPDFGYAYQCRAVMIRMRAHEWKEAIADLTRDIEIRPYSSGAHLFRSQCYAELGDMKHAIADADRTIELRPDDPSSHTHRAEVRLKFGRYRDAVADAQRAQNLPGNPITAMRLYNVAVTYSLAAAAAAKDPNLKDRNEVAEGYARRSLDTLVLAIARGWTEPQQVEHMSHDPNLDFVRSNPRFRGILETVKGISAARDQSQAGKSVPKQKENTHSP